MSLWGEGRGRGRTRACDTLICVGGPGCLSLHGKGCFSDPGEQVHRVALRRRAYTVQQIRDHHHGDPSGPRSHVRTVTLTATAWPHVVSRSLEIVLRDRVWALAAGWGMVRGAVARCQKLAATGPARGCGHTSDDGAHGRTVRLRARHPDPDSSNAADGRGAPIPNPGAAARFVSLQTLCGLSADSLRTLRRVPCAPRRRWAVRCSPVACHM